jgi:phage shock protein PspC (stress-responsive transcriptional regulator)
MSLESTQKTRFYKSQRYKVIGGVCSGIAIQKGWSIALTRLFALFTLGTGFGLILYIALWILMPSAKVRPTPEPVTLAYDPLTRTKNDRVIGGVCGGIAKLLGWDPLIIRVVFIVLLLSYGISLLPYLYAWIALPESETPEPSKI